MFFALRIRTSRKYMCTGYFAVIIGKTKRINMLYYVADYKQVDAVWYLQ